MFPRSKEEMRVVIENYKKLHHEKAFKKGVLTEFLAANTLTQCKKVLNGIKSKGKK